jgi:hypothetical protein
MQKIFSSVSMVFALTCVSLSLQAQLLTNHGLLHISNGSMLRVNGGLNNQQTISNHGHLKVSGDWTNEADFRENNGIVTLDGTAGQQLRHNSNHFYILRIEGGGEKQLLDTAYIATEIAFTDGIVNTESGAFLVVGSTANVEGGNFDSFVSGTLYHEGTGDKFYPVGRYGYYYPLLLESLSGTDPVTGIFYEEPNPSPMAGTNLDSISQSRYWQREQASGTFEEAYVTLIFDEMDGITDDDLGRLVVAEADSITQFFRSLGAAEVLGNYLDGTVSSEVGATARVFALGFASDRQVQGIFYVPTAFAPFSASLEDDRVVRVYGHNVSEENFVFRIYSQWGNLVYETNSFADANAVGWNGTHFQTQVEMPPGVYTFVLNGQFDGGDSFQEQGTITLLK